MGLSMHVWWTCIDLRESCDIAILARMTNITWMDNRKLMEEMWPKWKLEPVLSSLLNEKWGSLHQDKLQSCIRQHRLVRDFKPEIATIHKAYCALIPQNLIGEREVEQTRDDLQRCTPPSERELQEWDDWAAVILANVTDDEIEAVREQMTYVPTTNRVLAVAVEHVRLNAKRGNR